MNATSGGPHILLFERDQQLTSILSTELTRAGYEVHMARTAVEVFDTIARFPVKLVMVDLAQAQAGRREFWVALDAQRRGRGVQVFTFRCTNLGGYGPDDPDERVESVLTDLEVDGPGGALLLVEAVRARVPGSLPPPATPSQVRQALGIPEPAPGRSGEMSLPPFQPPSASAYASAPQPLPAYQPAQSQPIAQVQSMFEPMPQVQQTYQPAQSQPMPQVQQTYQPAQSQPMPQVQPQYQPAQSQSMPQVQPQYQPAQSQSMPQVQPQYQPAQSQPMPQTYQPTPSQVQPVYQPTQQVSPAYQPAPSQPMYQPAPAQQAPPAYQQMPMSQPQQAQSPIRSQMQDMQAPSASARSGEQTRHSTFTDKIRAVFHSNSHSFSPLGEANGSAYQAPIQVPEQQRLRPAQRLDEADYPTRQIGREEISFQVPLQSQAPAPSYTSYGVPPTSQASPVGPSESGLDQLSRMLRESQPGGPAPMQGQNPGGTARPGLAIDPQEIQDFRALMMQAARQDEAYSRNGVPRPASLENTGVQPQLRASPIQDQPFEQELSQRRGQPSGSFQAVNTSPSAQLQQAYREAQAIINAASQIRPPDTPMAAGNDGQMSNGSQPSGPLSQPSGPLNGQSGQNGAVPNGQFPRRLELKTTDDTLLDIVQSLPPMPSGSQALAPLEQPAVNGRATRSLGSVLLEGHLVPEERLQVAQHVQRMMSGVDLNYQLGEILLMFKLLTPDQLLAASLVSYGMISTIQISSLGRIRQELHAMGLEYDLENLLVLFRILTPEQLREVRATWNS